MRRRLAVLTLLAGSAVADSRIVTRQRFEHGVEVVHITYQQGQNWREEAIDKLGQRHRITIVRAQNRTLLSVDPDARQYTVSDRSPDLLQLLAASLRRTPGNSSSGKNINMYVEVVDTGERKLEFGVPIRHLQVHQRVVPDPGACAEPSESVTDGWYGPPASQAVPRPVLSSFLIASGPNHRLCHDQITFHGKLPEQALAFHLTETRSSGSGPSWAVTTDILEYSTAPLPESLFEPPAGFRRVDHLSGETRLTWTDRLGSDWQQLENAIGSWFD